MSDAHFLGFERVGIIVVDPVKNVPEFVIAIVLSFFDSDDEVILDADFPGGLDEDS